MSRAIQKNFRGLRALVIMANENGHQTLVGTLFKLGLDVTVAGSWPETTDNPVPFDVIFFDADDGSDTALNQTVFGDLPLIALIGSEAPSRLAHVIQTVQQATSSSRCAVQESSRRCSWR